MFRILLYSTLLSCHVSLFLLNIFLLWKSANHVFSLLIYFDGSVPGLQKTGTRLNHTVTELVSDRPTPIFFCLKSEIRHGLSIGMEINNLGRS